MVLKLLSPSELRDTKAQDTAREILRTKELKEAADKARKKLADAEADFSKMMSGQQARWAKEEQDHAKDVSERQAELKVLESRRVKALEPVILLEERAKKTLLEAQNQVIEAEKRENDATQLYERLQDALDDVGAREVDVLEREQKAKVHELNIEAQQKAIDEQSRFINDSMRELQSFKLKTETEMSKLRTALTLQEHSLNARAEKLKRTEEKLKVWAEQLEDERGTLERAFKRIRTQSKKKKV